MKIKTAHYFTTNNKLLNNPMQCDAIQCAVLQLRTWLDGSKSETRFIVVVLALQVLVITIIASQVDEENQMQR